MCMHVHPNGWWIIIDFLGSEGGEQDLEHMLNNILPNLK